MIKPDWFHEPVKLVRYDAAMSDLALALAKERARQRAAERQARTQPHGRRNG